MVILVGALILTLPISTTSGESTNFLDALFTATSAVCVTGLIVVDTGTYWNMFGQTVIMILIEIGGLGFMSFTTLIAIILGKKDYFEREINITRCYEYFQHTRFSKDG